MVDYVGALEQCRATNLTTVFHAGRQFDCRQLKEKASRVPACNGDDLDNVICSRGLGYAHRASGPASANFVSYNLNTSHSTKMMS